MLKIGWCKQSAYGAGMCVLAGCDFLPSIPGIGISKAYSLVSKYRNLDRVSIINFPQYWTLDVIFPYLEIIILYQDPQ